MTKYTVRKQAGRYVVKRASDGAVVAVCDSREDVPIAIGNAVRIAEDERAALFKAYGLKETKYDQQ